MSEASNLVSSLMLPAAGGVQSQWARRRRALAGLGFAVHFLWLVLVVAVILWVIGFFVGGVASGVGGRRRRWYGRWSAPRIADSWCVTRWVALPIGLAWN
jgi:hypothetical protein